MAQRDSVLWGLTVFCLAWPGAVGAQQAERTFQLPGETSMDMVWIRPGTFLMGAPDDEPGRFPGEGPSHEVTISKGFYLGKFELTQAQWEGVMGTRPWDGGEFVRSGPDYPAVYISWADVQEFIGRLNAAAGGEIYRLPTEAEWEYAARAGTQSIWSFGDEGGLLVEHAWFSLNAWNVGERYAHRVGRLKPNPWGLHDVHGNVWEWVQDWYGVDYYQNSPAVDPPGPESGAVRVVKGGYFHFDARATRSAARGQGNPAGRDYAVGARILREGTGSTAVVPRTWGAVKGAAR